MKKSLLPDLNPSDPVFHSARKISELAASVGYDWPQLEGILQKCAEELKELEQAIDLKSKKDISHELGDILFALSNLARHLELDPEEALRGTHRGNLASLLPGRRIDLRAEPGDWNRYSPLP